MRLRAVALAALAASLLAGPDARAAAPWSEPVDLGPGTGSISGQSLDFAAAGTPQFTYTFRTAVPTLQQPNPPRRGAIARRRPDGTVIRDVFHDDALALTRFGRRAWAVLRFRTSPSLDGRALLRLSTGSGPGQLGPPQTVARYRIAEDYDSAIVGESLPRIASGPAGGIAIVWTELAGESTTRVRVAYRLAGGELSRPMTVAMQGPRGTLRHPGVAFRGRSAVTVAFVREARVAGRTHRTVEARDVRLGDSAVTSQTVGPAPESYTDLRIAAAPGGRTMVAWANVHGTEMGAESPYVVRAALRAPGARRFGAPQVLDPGVVQVGPPGALGTGIADDGTATVAWSAYASTALFDPPVEVRAATAAPSHHFAARQVLTTSGHLTDLVVAGNGATLATWLDYSPGTGTVGAALRPAKAAGFGPAETVAAVPLRTFSPLDPGPDAAFDPGTGRFSIIWAIDESAGTQPVPGSARLLLSTRQG